MWRCLALKRHAQTDAHGSVCVCVCVCEREREGEGQSSGAILMVGGLISYGARVRINGRDTSWMARLDLFTTIQRDQVRRRVAVRVRVAVTVRVAIGVGVRIRARLRLTF